VVFATLAATVCAYHGFVAAGGPRGVSRAITRAMVISVLLIVTANVALSEVFYR
jgi:ABC-type transporter Mla maintaining outer membrane lipid asymmetry permease subunit MlaE